ncbi:group XIIA secretory phospholipase A2 [Brachionus plicatilis]|uniref:Group XIIA secretory phospholipase A2 n=1 Tax=Brachionus plicatilis TaxID=10195 RepID=A0A3M7R458_BRAPC|nr:group XIIA secretory phospholipase A2 [Brachionus plicatilis]
MNLYLLTFSILMIKLSKGSDSTSYLNDFWSMTERVGRKKPKSNPDHLPTPNGCGSYDFRIDFDRLNMHDITKCCNEHDTCYATCNKKKQDCDNLFRKCLLNFCDVKQKQIKINLLESVCLEVANFMHDMVKMFGCPVYGSSQKSACLC